LSPEKGKPDKCFATFAAVDPDLLLLLYVFVEEESNFQSRLLFFLYDIALQKQYLEGKEKASHYMLQNIWQVRFTKRCL
jgi:hypothetical protein